MTMESRDDDSWGIKNTQNTPCSHLIMSLVDMFPYGGL